MKARNLIRQIFFIPLSLLLFAACEKEETQGEFKPIDLTIDITDIDEGSAVVGVLPSDNTPTFYYSVISRSEYETLGGDDALVAWVVSDIGNPEVTGRIVSGYAEEAIASLKPSTEYIAYAFQLKSNGKSDRKVFKRDFSTLTILDDFEHDATVNNITAMGFSGEFRPADKTTLYYADIFTKAEYESFAGIGVRTFAQKRLDVVVNNAVADSPNFSREAVIANKVAMKGNCNKAFFELEEETEYVVWAGSIDEKGVLTSNPTITADVRTGKLVFADDVIVFLTLDAYYSGTELAEHDPAYENVRGRVLPYIFYQKSPLTSKSHLIFLEGDQSKSMSDAVVLSKLLRDDRYVSYTASDYVLIGPDRWGVTTICMVGFDHDGNYGHIFRIVVDFTKENVDDIQKLIDLLS